VPTPSDILARLNAALSDYLAPLAPSVVSRVLEGAEEGLLWSVDQADAWTVSGEGILAEAEVATAINAINRGLDSTSLPVVIAAMQRLDEWHAPTTDRGAAMGHRGGPEHVAASVRLEEEGRFNGEVGIGSVIPKRAEDWSTCGDHSVHERLIADYGASGRVKIDEHVYRTADLMEWTAYLPAAVKASHQDAGVGPDRSIALRYQRTTVDLDASAPRTGPLHIMIAPVLEREAEVNLTGDTACCTYGVRPMDFSSRLDDIVQAALDQKIDAIFMPEMSLSRASVAYLATALNEHRRAWIRVNRRLPNLSWVIAGVMDDQLGDGANYVVVLGPDGSEVVRQEKISRWNMEPDQQQQFDLAVPGVSVPPRMDEPIRGAPEVTVVDLPGLGRMTILICADMDVAMPGNWMFANASLDVIYAPIMDKTTPLRHAEPLDRQPWIVRRSFRAAAIARAKVVMTNSMPLTAIVNRTNAVRGLPFPPFTSCLVALLVDGTAEEVPYRELSVDLAAGSPVTQTVEWNNGWGPFDLPAPGYPVPVL
jgi:predicted amidohydrolase